MDFGGVSHPGLVVSTEEGIFWANKWGAWMYNGERVVEVLEASGASSEFKAYLDNLICEMNEASYYDALERANELRFGC